MKSLDRLKEDIDNTASKDPCPLTAMQASAIVHNLITIASKQESIEESIEEMQADISKICLESARRSGFKQGAGFWFKAGAVAMTVAVGGGLLILVALITGNVDIAAFTGAVIK